MSRRGRQEPPRRPREGLLATMGVAVAPELLERALTHRSYAYEQGGLPTNERLEFLGDAVLGLVVTERLFRDHPELPEGQLAKLRSSVVNMGALAEVGRTLGIGDFLLLGRGEESTGGRDKDSILADTVEALIGAVHLEHGLDVARSLVAALVGPMMTAAAGRGAGLDWKTSVQELVASRLLGSPDYVVTETGPDHAKSFVATLVVGGVPYGAGEGRSKKQAEQRAAAAAYESLSGAAGAGPAGPAAASP